MTRWVWMALVAIAAGMAGWVIFHDSGDGAVRGPGAGGPPRAMPVQAVPAERGNVAIEVRTVGSLDANESVVIRSEIAGRIGSIHFSEGEKVAKGGVLIHLDPSEYVAQVKQIVARVELNRLNFDRAEQLQKEKMISRQAYDEAAARLAESEANLALARVRMEKTKIAAPFSGRLGLRRVSPGDYIQPGQAIVNLEDLDPIKIDIRIPELYFAQVKTGQAVRLRVDAFPARTFDGRIYAIDPRIDTATHTLLLRARIPNPAGELRPGMFARVTLQLGVRAGAVLVPEEALVPMAENKFIYRIVEDKAVLTPVKVGERRGGKVEIIEGVGADDTVVIAGQAKIFDGAPVMVLGPAGGPSASGTAERQ